MQLFSYKLYLRSEWICPDCCYRTVFSGILVKTIKCRVSNGSTLPFSSVHGFGNEHFPLFPTLVIILVVECSKIRGETFRLTTQEQNIVH